MRDDNGPQRCYDERRLVPLAGPTQMRSGYIQNKRTGATVCACRVGAIVLILLLFQQFCSQGWPSSACRAGTCSRVRSRTRVFGLGLGAALFHLLLLTTLALRSLPVATSTRGRWGSHFSVQLILLLQGPWTDLSEELDRVDGAAVEPLVYYTT